MKRYIRADVTGILEEDPEVRRAVASDPNTRVSTLRTLLMDDDSGVLYYLAMNPSSPVDILMELAAKSMTNPYLSRALAKAPNTTPEILEFLSFVQDGYVQSLIAQNPKTPKGVLTRLAEGYHDVRLSALTNPNIDQKLLEKYGSGDDFQTAMAVLQNPTTPEHVLRQMYDAHSGMYDVQSGIAKHPNTPLDILEELAINSYSTQARIDVAKRTDIPAELLAKIAESETQSFNVLEAVVKNPNTPVDVIEDLIANPENDDLFDVGSVKRVLQNRGIDF